MVQAWFSLLTQLSSAACMAAMKTAISRGLLQRAQTHVHLHGYTYGLPASFPKRATSMPGTGRDSLRRHMTWWLSSQHLNTKVAVSRGQVEQHQCVWESRLLLLPELPLPQWRSGSKDALELYSSKYETIEQLTRWKVSNTPSPQSEISLSTHC